jgi:hypothetical protein
MIFLYIYSFETVVYKQDVSSVQVFVEPVEHVCKSLFSAFNSERVGGIVSASKSMGNSWEDLDKVFNLQERQRSYTRVRFSSHKEVHICKCIGIEYHYIQQEATNLHSFFYSILARTDALVLAV